MSDAVDNAEVMLSCISLAYKESASKLLCYRWSPYGVHASIVCRQLTSGVAGAGAVVAVGAGGPVVIHLRLQTRGEKKRLF
jgi:hypothetical protein